MFSSSLRWPGHKEFVTAVAAIASPHYRAAISRCCRELRLSCQLFGFALAAASVHLVTVFVSGPSLGPCITPRARVALAPFRRGRSGAFATRGPRRHSSRRRMWERADCQWASPSVWWRKGRTRAGGCWAGGRGVFRLHRGQDADWWAVGTCFVCISRALQAHTFAKHIVASGFLRLALFDAVGMDLGYICRLRGLWGTKGQRAGGP